MYVCTYVYMYVYMTAYIYVKMYRCIPIYTYTDIEDLFWPKRPAPGGPSSSPHLPLYMARRFAMAS